MNSKKKIFDDNLPPTNPFAERAILNILITNGQNTSLLKDNIPNIKLYSFYDESNRLIYQTICELCEKNLLVNLTSVMSTLLSKGILKKVGGVEKITTILNMLSGQKFKFFYFIYISRPILSLKKLGYLKTVSFARFLFSRIRLSFFVIVKF